jgi:hypothetical protein
LGLVYYCRLAGDTSNLPKLAEAQNHHEILSLKWVDPTAITCKLSPLEHRGILLAQQVYHQEQARL